MHVLSLILELIIFLVYFTWVCKTCQKNLRAYRNRSLYTTCVAVHEQLSPQCCIYFCRSSCLLVYLATVWCGMWTQFTDTLLGNLSASGSVSFFFFFSFNVLPLRLLNAVSRLDEVGYSLSRVVSTNKSVAGFEFGSIWKRWWAVIKFTLPAPLFLACSVFSPFFFISSFQCQEETNVVTYHTCIV